MPAGHSGDAGPGQQVAEPQSPLLAADATPPPAAARAAPAAAMSRRRCGAAAPAPPRSRGCGFPWRRWSGARAWSCRAYSRRSAAASSGRNRRAGRSGRSPRWRSSSGNPAGRGRIATLRSSMELKDPDKTRKNLSFFCGMLSANGCETTRFTPKLSRTKRRTVRSIPSISSIWVPRHTAWGMRRRRWRVRQSRWKSRLASSRWNPRLWSSRVTAFTNA